MYVCCLDRGKTATQARSRKRTEQLILEQELKRSKEFSSEIDELDKEDDRLADRLEEHMKDKPTRPLRGAGRLCSSKRIESSEKLRCSRTGCIRSSKSS